MEEEDTKSSDKLSLFLDSGIYRFDNSNVVFIDPVRVLNRSYTRFRVSPSSYYSRFFESKLSGQDSSVLPDSRKRKRHKKKPHSLNVKERVAEQRHQEVRPFLSKAHECLMGATDLLGALCNLSNEHSSTQCSGYSVGSAEQSFVDLGRVWQASLCEITLNFHQHKRPIDVAGSSVVEQREQRVLLLYDNLVVNETDDDVEAEFLSRKYILPKDSGFYMSDRAKLHNLIHVESDYGFNVIVVDPPWENGSARQKLRYPTLPNRYFLSIPVKQLADTEGALVALWVTNKEKLRCFVEKELFPTWGVRYMTTFYWLKVKPNGSLISDLDLFHHRPYECLLLGYCCDKVDDNLSKFGPIQNQVIISIPGDYSRKPPIGELLKEYVPGLKSIRGVELFAREMIAGWTSWGNEPLHFQDSRFLIRKEDG